MFCRNLPAVLIGLLVCIAGSACVNDPPSASAPTAAPTAVAAAKKTALHESQPTVTVSGEQLVYGVIENSSPQLSTLLPVASLSIENGNVAAGEAVVLGFRVSNTTSASARLLVWGSPLEDTLTAPIFDLSRLDEEGNSVAEIPYQGIMIKRGPATDAAFIEVGPGRFVESQQVLDKAYDLSASGDYRVRFAPLTLQQDGTFLMGDISLLASTLELHFTRSKP